MRLKWSRSVPCNNGGSGAVGDGINVRRRLGQGGLVFGFSRLRRQTVRFCQCPDMIRDHMFHPLRCCAAEMLNGFDVDNKIINSKIKELPDQDDYSCFVAMVETLNNRLNDELFEVESIGLIIVDEAHYNSFRKIFFRIFGLLERR